MNYPYDIVSLVRNKTLSIEAHFVQETEESPMKVFDETFSRFSCNIIKDGVSYFNIPIESLPGMRAKTDIAAKEQFMPKQITPKTGTDVDTTGPAFTKRFISGTLKGKTPIDVLLEDPIDGKDSLNKQYKWLKDNLSKYPKNQELMDAILEAAKVDVAALGEVTTGTTSVVTEILDIGCRPLIRKKREDGKCFVYEGKITWDRTKNYPVVVSIKNYYADVKKNDNGTLNVNISSKDTSSEVTRDFNMTAEEWMYCMYSMESARDCFKMIHFKQAYQKAEEAGAKARQAARERQSA